jgi:hypothetical protein
VIEFVIVLWPPFLQQDEPTFIGMPFFYWYQFLCVIISATETPLRPRRWRESG